MKFKQREQWQANWFDEDYFEKGSETGKSLYTRYRYLPERTHQEANAIISWCGENGFELLPKHKIVDFGCAKGFLITELLARGFDIYGVDISQYAVDNVEFGAKHRVKLVPPITTDTRIIFPYWKTLAGFDFSLADFVIARDVLEHMDESTLDETLHVLGVCSTHMFICIPVGDEESGFFIDEMNWDTSHILPRTAAWWYERFVSMGWHIRAHTNRIHGLKVNWETKPYGFHFFLIASYGVPALRHARP